MVKTHTYRFRTMCLTSPLITAFNELQQSFTVSSAQLAHLADVFESEMDRGLAGKKDSIPMNPTWVTRFPTGNETGTFLSIDMGGTNLRVCVVKLLGNSEFEFSHLKYMLPGEIRTGSAITLFDFIASCLESFLKDGFCGPLDSTRTIPLGFTFSFPATQSRIDEGILQTWTKGFDVANVEGHDVVPMLQRAIDALKLPIKVTALINDTTGTLVASKYSRPDTKMGLIFGTGVNGAYYDWAADVPKLGMEHSTAPMAINTEYGAFDNAQKYLPRTKYDEIIDRESPRPGQQTYEKLVAGYYMGEILRVILVDLYEQGLLFAGQNVTGLYQKFILDTSFPAQVEEDDFSDLRIINRLMTESFEMKTSLVEREMIQNICRLIGIRSARLGACSIKAIAQRMNYKFGDIACDGSVFKKYPFFQERVLTALRELNCPLQMVPAEDGSGVGAAIIACIANY